MLKPKLLGPFGPQSDGNVNVSMARNIIKEDKTVQPKDVVNIRCIAMSGLSANKIGACFIGVSDFGLLILQE